MPINDTLGKAIQQAQLSINWSTVFTNTLPEVVYEDAMQAGATPGFDDALVRNLTAGTGADKARYVWHDYFTLSASGGTQTINLAGLSDKWNAVFAFTLIKWLMFVPVSGEGTLTLSAAASNGWGATTTAPYGTDKLIVHDLCLLTSQSIGWGVSSSSRNLKLTNTGGSGIAFLLLLAGQ